MNIKRAGRFGFLQIRALVALLLFGAAICLAKFSLAPVEIAKGERKRGDVDRLRFMPEPGGEKDDFDRMEAEWQTRLTYPTGIFNPEWLRAAASVDALVPRAIPA